MSKRGAILTDVIIISLAIILILTLTVVAANLLGISFFGEYTAADTTTLQHFENLIDEVEHVLGSGGIYAQKNVPFHMNKEFVILAFNSGQDFIKAQYRRLEDANTLINPIFLVERPDSCFGSCICLLRIKNKDLKSDSKITDILDYDKPKCRDFDPKIKFYSYYVDVVSYNSEGVHRTNVQGGYSADISETRSQRRYSNYGLDQDPVLDGSLFPSIVASQVSGYYDSGRTSDGDIQGMTTYTETGRYLKSAGYSDVLLTEAIPPKAKYDNDDKTDNIYLQKVDFSKVRNDDDSVHVFLVPIPAGSLYDFEMLGASGGFQQGEYTVFDLREKMFSPLANKEAPKYSRYIAGAINDYKIYHFLDYFYWTINPMLFEDFDTIVNLEVLGQKNLEIIRDLIGARMQSCATRLTDVEVEECLRVYSECDEIDDENVCDTLQRKREKPHCDTFKGDYSILFRQFLNADDERIRADVICDNLDEPQLLFDFLSLFISSRFNDDELDTVLYEIESLEKNGDFIGSYERFLNFLRSEGYDTPEKIDALFLKFPRLGYFKKAFDSGSYTNFEVGMRQVIDAGWVFYVVSGEKKFLLVTPNNKGVPVVYELSGEIDLNNIEEKKDLDDLDYSSKFGIEPIYLLDQNDREKLYFATHFLVQMNLKGCITLAMEGLEYSVIPGCSK